jgi:C-terminal processing protease CtpA/Prc
MLNNESASLRGRALLHEVWRTVNDKFYDPARLAEVNWSRYEHLYDERIVDVESARACAKEMLAALGDAYTRLLDTEAVVAKLAERASEESNVITRMLPGKVGFIRILSFSQSNIVEQVAAAADEIKDCERLIVDLRDNGGGLIDATGNCLELFIRSGTLIFIDKRHGAGVKRRIAGLAEDRFITINETPGEEDEVDFYIRREPILAGKPTVVVINDGTASSAEIFAAALLDNSTEDAPRIAVGDETAGKGIGQGDADILGEWTLKLSFIRFSSPNDVWFGDAGQRVRSGVKPSIKVEESDDVNAPLHSALCAVRELVVR